MRASEDEPSPCEEKSLVTCRGMIEPDIHVNKRGRGRGRGGEREREGEREGSGRGRERKDGERKIEGVTCSFKDWE